MHILREDFDGRLIRAHFGLKTSLRFHRDGQQPGEAVFDRQDYLLRSRTGALHKQAMQQSQRRLFRHQDPEGQEAFLFATTHGQDPMRGGRGHGFFPFGIVPVFTALHILASHAGGFEQAVLQVQDAHVSPGC